MHTTIKNIARAFFFFLLFVFIPLPSMAQLVQSAVIPLSVLIAPNKVHTITLPKPVTQGNFLILFMRNCNSATNPVQPFTDSQPANVWQDTDIYHSKWYVESAAAGVTTLTFTGAAPNYCEPLFAEFSGSYTLDVISHPLYSEDVTIGTSYEITPSQPGELILGFATSDCGCAGGYGPLISPGAGFQFAAFSDPALIEYEIQQAAAPIVASFIQSFSADTIVFVAAFKPKPGCKV